MGVNARFSDAPSELTTRITQQRNDSEAVLRAKIRAGQLSIREYLVRYKGLRDEYVVKFEPKFRQAILGG